MTKENVVVAVEPIENAEGETTGIKVTIGGEHRTLHWHEIPQSIIGYSIFFGLANKVRDTAAIKRNTENGQPAAPEEKAEKVFRTLEGIKAGEWTVGRGEAGPKGGILYFAFKEAYPEHKAAANPAAFAEWIEAQAKANDVKETIVRADLRKRAKIAPIYDRMKAAQPAPKAKEVELDLE